MVQFSGGRPASRFCGNEPAPIDGAWRDLGGNALLDSCACVGDIDGDTQIDVGDLLAVLAAWGSTGPVADVDGDGVVAVSDLLLVLDGWGRCEP